MEKHGATYVAALIHAMITGSRGCWHVAALLQAPTASKLAIVDGEWHAAALATADTNVVFFSWLLYDVLHVIREFPALGGLDTVAHHLGFMCASLVCGHHRILPFPFAWLILGELSSVPLNIRWFLTTIAKADPKRASKWASPISTTSKAFALVFFVTRVVVYGMGLAHLCSVTEELGKLDAVVAKPLLYLVLALLAGGYVLNLSWMSKIVKRARQASKE